MSHCGLGLSCEPLPCEHGKELRKEQCHLCELKTQIMALTDMYKSLSVRVVGQHDFKLNQIDINSKMDKKIEDIISKLAAWDDDLEYLDSMKLPKRIAALESQVSAINKQKFSEFHHLKPDIEKLEKQIANWEEEFYFLKDKLRSPDKKPHKCPLCDGCGVAGELALTHCKPCEGTGIVWG